MTKKTMSHFRNLIISENFFGISRPHLIEDQITRLICDAISFTVIITITSLIILDVITTKYNIGCRTFEIIICIEYYNLAGGSRFRKEIFYAIERLDEKCGVEEEYGAKIRAQIIKNIIIFLPSVIIDIIGLIWLGVNSGMAVFLSVAFAAHDAEMTFVGLLIETFNQRLEKLKGAAPNAGSRAYRHILITAAHFSEQYTPRILLMLAITLMTSVAYEFILVLADSKTIFNLSLYLIWRESRSMYSLWLLCSPIARTGTVCSDLALNLAGRLTQNESVSKEKNPGQYKTVQRWHSIVISKRPEYISASILSVGLGTPMLVLDLSINYMLILVQMYLAYQ